MRDPTFSQKESISSSDILMISRCGKVLIVKNGEYYQYLLNILLYLFKNVIINQLEFSKNYFLKINLLSFVVHNPQKIVKT